MAQKKTKGEILYEKMEQIKRGEALKGDEVDSDWKSLRIKFLWEDWAKQLQKEFVQADKELNVAKKIVPLYSFQGLIEELHSSLVKMSPNDPIEIHGVANTIIEMLELVADQNLSRKTEINKRAERGFRDV